MTILSLLFNNQKVRDFSLVNGQSLTIGRNPDNDIVIDSLAVSGYHARVDCRGSKFTITDLGITADGALTSGTLTVSADSAELLPGNGISLPRSVSL